MNNLQTKKSEPTAVDDVRLVREKIAREHGGDLRKHLEETNRIGGKLWAKLNVRMVSGRQQDFALGRIPQK